EYCPHCFQAGGPASVRRRAEDQTNTDILKKYNNGGWPLGNVPLAENGNFLEPEEIAVRHGKCGDPSQVRIGTTFTDNRYGLDNSLYPIMAEYKSGAEIKIKTVTSTYHWGHLEYFICDAADLPDPDGPVTQECFNKHPLTRVFDESESPIDENSSGRYFLDPACRATETDQTHIPPGAYKGQVSTMTYQLPDITCERCILQMVYCE
ncbi:unnamed protein product, partial [Discosporangium mesarthrocarpum]